MIVHGFVPDDLRLSTIVPIPKGKKRNQQIQAITEVLHWALYWARFLICFC